MLTLNVTSQTPPLLAWQTVGTSFTIIHIRYILSSRELVSGTVVNICSMNTFSANTDLHLHFCSHRESCPGAGLDLSFTAKQVQFLVWMATAAEEPTGLLGHAGSKNVLLVVVLIIIYITILWNLYVRWFDLGRSGSRYCVSA